VILVPILLLSVLLLPAAGAAVCLLCPSVRAVLWAVRAGVVLTAVAALGCVWAVHDGLVVETAWSWLRLDALSAYHLAVMMLVFTLSSLYLPGYFGAEAQSGHFTGPNARRFGALWFGALAAMGLVLLSNNIGIMWVGIEATTLVTAFLICIHRTPASLEAMWKYLIICSVGVAFAFMGTLLAGAAAEHLRLEGAQMLLWSHLRENASRLDPALMKVAFLFLLVGYGTKAGLAPMHSWLPDAHSQAPGPVSALFSGFMLNASLYCIMRYLPLVEAATGGTGWGPRLVLLLGLVSIVVAAVFILFQTDLKRLLAYSSVEHMGIIAVGLGLGGPGILAALFHTLNHSLCKPLAFFAAGRLGQMYGTHDTARLSGCMRAAPVWGRALFGSLLVVIGVAPFAVFMSEFMVLRAAARSGAWWTLGIFLIGVGIVFIGVLRQAINMAWGEPVAVPKQEQASPSDRVMIVAVLGALLVLGLWFPDALAGMLGQASKIVEGTP
jgi:hydrogenase-4 component F